MRILIKEINAIKKSFLLIRNMSSKEKFLIVMETYTLSETELSKYCRGNGLYDFLKPCEDGVSNFVKGVRDFIYDPELL